MVENVLEKLIKEAGKLEKVPPAASLEYVEKKEVLLEDVNKQLTDHPSLHKLIGQNPLEVMQGNHENHFKFMCNVFIFNDFELLVRTVQWVYRSYHARGFSTDYFPSVVSAYLKGVEKHLEPGNAPSINNIYRWMLEKHQDFIELSRQEPELPFTMDKSWGRIQEQFLEGLLQGDHQYCLKIADKTVEGAEDLGGFYLEVIQPVMYRVGILWEKGDISVAQEHLATAIVSRVMASLYPRFITIEHSRGKAIITAAPNEFHELGGRVVADLLEIDGWDVSYLGANVPAPDLFKMTARLKPQILGISVGMAFNMDRAREIINGIKTNPDLNDTRIMLGGQFLLYNPDSWRLTGADGWGSDGKSAVELARSWWEEKG